MALSSTLAANAAYSFDVNLSQEPSSSVVTHSAASAGTAFNELLAVGWQERWPCLCKLQH